MPRYSLKFDGVAGGPANNAAYFNFWCATRRASIRELTLLNTNAATALVNSVLIRTSARGTQSTTITPTAASNAYDTADANPAAVLDNAWSVQPTFLPLSMRGLDVAGTIQSGVIWNWQDERDGVLKVPIGAGLAIQNISGGAIAVVPRFWIDWEE